MNIEIKHRWTNNTLYACEAESVKDAALSAVKNKAYLRGADLRGAYLRDADLGGADLGGAYLRGADLRSAYLRGADLRSAYLRGADLRDADLSGADLRDAYLGGAYLGGADLRSAYLRGADLRGADLSGEKLKQTPISILNLTWDILITDSFLTIGCQRHSHAEWSKFSDEEIKRMEHRAINFWNENKAWLLALCEVHHKKSLGIEDKVNV